MDKPFEICKPGSFIAMSGDPVTLSEDALRRCAAVYNPSLSEAPIVVGHPEHNHPAYGWIKGAAFHDGALWATPGEVEPAFADAVREGRWRKRSASFFAPHSAGNPVPGEWYLRHVGFLGAAPPAVKGMREVAFADGGADIITDLAGFTGSLAAREKVLRDRENLDFCQGLVKKAILRASEVPGIMALLDHLDGAPATLEFSDGDEAVKTGAGAMVRKFLEQRPPLVHLGEFVKSGRAEFAQGAMDEPDMPAGVVVDPGRMDLHRRAVVHQHQTGCDYATAVKAVAGRG